MCMCMCCVCICLSYQRHNGVSVRQHVEARQIVQHQIGLLAFFDGAINKMKNRKQNEILDKFKLAGSC